MTRLSADTIENTACGWAIRADGEMTAQEYAQLTAWIDANPRHRVAFLRLRKSWIEARRLTIQLEENGELYRLEELKRKPSRYVNDLTLIDLGYVRLAAYRITRNVAVAHDIAQNVFTRLLELEPEKLAFIGCLQAFAVQAARNEARNWLRARARDVSAERLAGIPADEHSDPVFAVLRALAMLPARAQVPLVLCKIYGYSAEEVAARLDISVEAVWKRVERAFRRLVKAGLRPPPPAPRSRVGSLFNRKEQ